MILAQIWPGVPRHWLFPSASGGHPPRLTPFGGWVYCPAPEAPLIRGMPTGPLVFLAMLGACGLLPCDQIHLKKALNHIHPVGGQMINHNILFFFYFRMVEAQMKRETASYISDTNSQNESLVFQLLSDNKLHKQEILTIVKDIISSSVFTVNILLKILIKCTF